MNENLIDPEAWETLKSMGDPAFLAELIGEYLKDSPDLIQQMRTGLAKADSETVRRAAHTLKSTSASLGASRLADASRELELLAKGGALLGGDSQVGIIEAEFDRLAPVLIEMIK